MAGVNSRKIITINTKRNAQKRRKNEHLQIWLKTRDLLINNFNYNPDDTNNSTNRYDQQLLESNKESIMESFGGFNQILNALIQTGNEQQLINVYDTLKQIRLNNKPISSKNSNNIDETDIAEQSQQTDSNTYSGFNFLSTEEICCVTGYLQRRNLLLFKACSRKIAIDCLQQMQKTTIGVYNMNKLITHQYQDLLKLKTGTLMSFNRYPSHINHSLMFSLWGKDYNIPIERQLVCHCNNNKFPILTTKLHLDYFSVSSSKISTVKSRNTFTKKSYLFFDTINVVVLTAKSVTKMSQFKESVDNINYKVLILKYYDIFNQRIDIVNFMLIHKDITFLRLFDYIQNKFITNDKNQEWYTTFKQRLHEVNVFGSAAHTFSIHKEPDNIHQFRYFHEKAMDKIFNNMSSQIFVFQFNSNHDYIKQYAKTKEQQTLSKIYTKSICFIKDYNKVTIRFEDYNDDSFPTVLSYLQFENQQNKHKPFQFLVGKTWSFGLLRKKIVSNLNNDSVNCRNIELFATKYSENNVLQRISDNEIVANRYNCGGYTFKWKLVSYNTLNTTSNECVYRLKIYLSRSSINAIQFKAKHVLYPILLRYNKSFKIKDFCDHLFKHITDIYSQNQFASILPLLSSNNNLLTASSRCYTMNEAFINNQRNLNLRVCDLNLYIMQHNGINKVDNTKDILRIRFVDGKQRFSSGVSYSKGVDILCGIPYLISFSRNSDWQSIIDGTGFPKWLKHNINCCYKFSASGYSGTSRCVETVSRKASSYKHINIFQEVMKFSPNECLVIKLKQGLDEY